MDRILCDSEREIHAMVPHAIHDWVQQTSQAGTAESVNWLAEALGATSLLLNGIPGVKRPKCEDNH